MNDILLTVQAYLLQAQNGQSSMSEEILDEAAAAFREALDKQFNGKDRREGFTLRLSALGRPTCQLQMEKAGTAAEQPGYNHTMKMLIGDMVEVAAIAVMKAAGVPITATQQRVTLQTPGADVNGTLDLEVAVAPGKEVIYDVKSASRWAFDNKFAQGFAGVAKSDDFGYVDQGFGYAKARGKPFGGWIVICKETGEWCVTEVPDDPSLEGKSIAKIEETVDTLVNRVPFKRCFTDEPETFRKRPTGNRILGTSCSFCQWKYACWPGVQAKPALASESRNPPIRYYTHINPATET